MTDDIWSQKLDRADMAWADSGVLLRESNPWRRGSGQPRAVEKHSRYSVHVLATATAPELQPDRHHQTPYFVLFAGYCQLPVAI